MAGPGGSADRQRQATEPNELNEFKVNMFIVVMAILSITVVILTLIIPVTIINRDVNNTYNSRICNT